MSDSSVDIEKPRLLVVEDSATMRMALKRILKEEYDVVEAKDGELGWEKITQDDTLRAVFSDLMMPNKDGFQLLHDIRNSDDERIKDLPVIIITGADDDDAKRSQALDAGASDFITKPFDSSELRARARTYVRLGEPMKAPEDEAASKTIDSVTRLPNKNYFDHHGSQQLAAAIRSGASLSFLRINIDQYEELFRKRGRRVAEKIAQFLGKLLQSNVRTEDTVARLGPDKFGVLMYGCGHESAEEVAERIHQRAGKTGFQLGNDRFSISVTAALITPDVGVHITFQELCKRSEECLYTAINAGGNTFVSETLSLSEQVEPNNQVPELSLDEALALLAAGDNALVDRALPDLIRRVIPLLERADRQLHLGVGFLLEQFRKAVS